MTLTLRGELLSRRAYACKQQFMVFLQTLSHVIRKNKLVLENKVNLFSLTSHVTLHFIFLQKKFATSLEHSITSRVLVD